MVARQLFQASAGRPPFCARSWLISVCCAVALYGSTAATDCGGAETKSRPSANVALSERRRNLPMREATGHVQRGLRSSRSGHTPLPVHVRIAGHAEQRGPVRKVESA